MKFDAIVIGAGAAGLAAARSLTGAGQRICILEARPRIGGRVFTQRVTGLPLPIELGAEFVHGESETTFSIIDAASLIAAELPDDHHWIENGKRERVDFWSEIDKVRRKVATLQRDISFAEFLRRHRFPPRLRELACNFVEGYHASHADRISAQVLGSADEEQEGDNRQFRIADGQSALVDWLRSGIDPDLARLFLGTPAERIEWAPNRVTVHAAGQRFTARALVVTIPIGVWKAGALAFDPPLPEKERAIDNLEAGHVVKIAFHFRERFWDEINFLHSNDCYMPTWWTSAPLRSHVLTGWAGGHAADALLTESDVTGRALDSMSKAWQVPRRKLDALLVGTFTHDWQADPYARCAYSYAAVGGTGAHDALAKPIRGTLFFAGEATSSDQTGTVAGAIESGRRAARELLRATAPERLPAGRRGGQR